MKDKKKVLAILAVVLIFVLYLMAFFGKFIAMYAGQWSGDLKDWAAFGSYYGGVLSPFLSFLSFMAVILFFGHEMKLKRKDEDQAHIVDLLQLLNESYKRMAYYDRYAKRTLKENEIMRVFLDAIFRLDELYDKLKHLDVDDLAIDSSRPGEKNIKGSDVDWIWFSDDVLKNVTLSIEVDGYFSMFYLCFCTIYQSSLRDRYLPVLQTQLSMDAITCMLIRNEKEINTNKPFKDFLTSIYPTYYKDWEITAMHIEHIEKIYQKLRKE